MALERTAPSSQSRQQSRCFRLLGQPTVCGTIFLVSGDWPGTRPGTNMMNRFRSFNANCDPLQSTRSALLFIFEETE